MSIKSFAFGVVGAVVFANAAASAQGDNRVLTLPSNSAAVNVGFKDLLTSPNNTGEMTIEFWIRREGTYPYGRPFNMRGCSCSGITIQANVQDQTGLLQLEIGNVTGTGTVPFSLSAWHHFAIVWAKSQGIIRVFHNGELEIEITVPTGNNIAYCGSEPLRFGNQCGHGVVGAMDNIRYWAVARTLEQVRANMTIQFSPEQAAAQSGLLGSWTFEDGTPSDGTGNNPVGTLESDATVSFESLPSFDQDNDGVPDAQDNCPAVSNPSQVDCNNNGIGEACESFTDCNANMLPDSCDIASGAAQDCNANGIPDSCEIATDPTIDCNSNSLPDSCDISSGTSADADSNGIPDSCQPDCNLNNLPDAWEIATGRATDYNADGIPDTCQGAVMVDSTTGNLGAPSGLATREHSFTALPFAESAVTITIDLIGDLNRVTEYVDVSLNGGTARRFFEADGNDCPATPDRAIITLTRAEFNALISPNGGTGAILVVSMTGSAGVDSSECKNAALTQFRLQYVGIQAKSGDCNSNNRLDIAETHDGTTPDCNLNTVPDSCDIARGAAQDCNLNGVPDSCELATTPALDCNTNGIIDSCDLANGGTTVDCDQNGRIDSCQVTETPGTDCNGNLRPDACDIASGTSGDIDHNSTPDECQTVTVPGQYADIQAAIDAAPASEMRIISVAAGTYAGPIAFNGKPVIVRGAGAVSTVIDGASGQTLSVVRFNGGEPAIAALERMTVRGGITGTPIPSSPTVLAGGGIFGLDSAASVRDCVVEQNASGFGAGAYFLRCTGEVRGCTFRNNNASSDGGGFQSNQGTQQLMDVLIENNVCNSRGAGMHLVQGTPTLTRVTVRNNYSNNLIGGVSWYALGDATAAAMLDDCVVTGNSALVTQGGIGISAASTGVPTISLRTTNVCNNTPRPNINGAWLDLGGNAICDCVGDLTLDGLVNGADLGILLAGWGACTGSCASDLNRDGVVNGADLGVLLAAWGVCGG
jgi:hypothetical protein